MMPGPANYERKRMFDNKQAIDYTKRFQTMGYNTTTGGFPGAPGATTTEGTISNAGVGVGLAGSDMTWNDSKPVMDNIIESPTNSSSA